MSQVTIDKFKSTDGTFEYEILVIDGRMKPICVRVATGQHVAFHIDALNADRFAISMAKFLEFVKLNTREPKPEIAPMNEARRKFGTLGLARAGK